VRRKSGSLVPLEIAICTAAANLGRAGEDEFHGYEMAKTLRIKIEQLEILGGGYYSEGAAQVQMAQASALRLLAEIADGKRTLPISVKEFPPASAGGPQAVA